jgi:hypothetical protein
VFGGWNVSTLSAEPNLFARPPLPCDERNQKLVQRFRACLVGLFVLARQAMNFVEANLLSDGMGAVLLLLLLLLSLVGRVIRRAVFFSFAHFSQRSSPMNPIFCQQSRGRDKAIYMDLSMESLAFTTAWNFGTAGRSISCHWDELRQSITRASWPMASRMNQSVESSPGLAPKHAFQQSGICRVSPLLPRNHPTPLLSHMRSCRYDVRGGPVLWS